MMCESGPHSASSVNQFRVWNYKILNTQSKHRWSKMTQDFLPECQQQKNAMIQILCFSSKDLIVYKISSLQINSFAIQPFRTGAQERQPNFIGKVRKKGISNSLAGSPIPSRDHSSQNDLKNVNLHITSYFEPIQGSQKTCKFPTTT